MLMRDKRFIAVHRGGPLERELPAEIRELVISALAVRTGGGVGSH